MKIIKQGEPPKSRFPMQITCTHCNSVLEIEASDTRGGQYGDTIVECPVCKAYIDVPN